MALGFALLRAGDPHQAAAAFRRALELFPEHARTLVGLAAANLAAGESSDAESAFTRATTAIDALRRGGRGSEANLSEAMYHAVRGDADRSTQALIALLERPDLPFSGWTIPIEPLLEPIRTHDGYKHVTTKLADRAR